MAKFNLETNWHGTYGSDGWQVVSWEPIEASSAEEAEENCDMYLLKGCLCTLGEDGENVPIEGVEYRFVEVEATPFEKCFNDFLGMLPENMDAECYTIEDDPKEIVVAEWNMWQDMLQDGWENMDEAHRSQQDYTIDDVMSFGDLEGEWLGRAIAEAKKFLEK